jgi:hypothetical protein
MRHKSVLLSHQCSIRSSKIARCATAVVLLWVSAMGALRAQESNAPALQPKDGFHIGSVSGYEVYYSSFLPNSGTGVQRSSTNVPADIGGGGSIMVDWTKFTARSSFSLNYTPSYTGYVRNSSLNALNHALSLSTSRKIASRWTVGFAAAGALNSLEQSLFSPTTLSNVASVPATFDDLAAGILSAKFTNNPQLGTVLTSSPLVESPVSNLLYGQRMLTASSHVSLSYSYSPRFSVTFSGGGSRSQQFSEGQTTGVSNTALINNTTSGDASVSISYSLSPVTQLGSTVTSSRTISSLQDVYTTTSMATLGKTLGRRWLIQIQGGVGFTNPLRQTTFPISTTPRPVVGGSLAYKTFAHTFLGSFDRAVSDSYGLGASTSTSANATWHWRRPGTAWWLDSSFGWQWLQGNALADTSGWHTTVGFNRAIGAHIVFLTQYAHLAYSGNLQAATHPGGLQASPYHQSQDALRVSVVWTPQAAVLQ